MRTEEEDRTQAEAQRDFDLLQEDMEGAFERAYSSWRYVNQFGKQLSTEDDWKLIRWAMGIK